MNAFEIPGIRYSLPAGGAVAKHRFVKVNAGGLATQADATSAIVGASRNAVETDKGVTAAQQIVEIADGIVVVEASAAIVAGVQVSSTADGMAVTHTTEAVIAGVALTDATGAGSFVTVKIS